MTLDTPRSVIHENKDRNLPRLLEADSGLDPRSVIHENKDRNNEAHNGPSDACYPRSVIHENKDRNPSLTHVVGGSGSTRGA